MAKDKEFTDVIFRKNKDEVFALFPHNVCDIRGNVTSYSHVGQHSGADYQHCIKTSKLATNEEFMHLYNELEQIGYKLNVVKRQNYKKYLVDYRKG
jgi:hypothetical protein